MDDKVEIEITIGTMFSVNAHYRTVIRVDREEWGEMSEKDREEYMLEECERVMYEQVDVAWKPLNA